MGKPERVSMIIPMSNISWRHLGVSVFFHTWVDVAEIVSDFAWGVFALAHYFGEI
jgi:hypothetical protein